MRAKLLLHRAGNCTQQPRSAASDGCLGTVPGATAKDRGETNLPR
jgi:hypothetical protein